MLILLQVSCTDADNITLDLNKEDVDFSVVVNGGWNKLCIIKPYSDNSVARSLLGFDWDLEAKSEIHDLDNITLLVFATDLRVIQFSEVSRKIDFSKFGNICIERDDAKFKIENNDISYTGNSPLN